MMCVLLVHLLDLLFNEVNYLDLIDIESIFVYNINKENKLILIPVLLWYILVYVSDGLYEHRTTVVLALSPVSSLPSVPTMAF